MIIILIYKTKFISYSHSGDDDATDYLLPVEYA